MAATPDRHPGALTEDDEIRLVSNATSPTVAGAFNYNGSTFLFRDAAGTFNPRTSLPGTNVLWVLDGGSYTSIQAAIDAAADQSVLLVGPKSGGSWGPAAFPAGKRLAVVGLAPKLGEQVKVDSVSFAPSTGANILLNTVYVRGLMITGSFVGSQGVSFAGSAPARLRLQECYIYNSGASGNGVVSDNGGSGSSLYLDNCTVQSGVSTGVGVNHVRGYTSIKGGCEVSRWQYALQCAAGNVEILNALLDTTGISNEAVRISGGVVTVGYSTIKNTNANAIGVNLTAASATLGMGDATFAIAAGSGYCVRGVSGSYFLYGRITYSHSAAAAYNVKVQNTVSAVPVAQAFTSSQ
jgi:hypothetical protein